MKKSIATVLAAVFMLALAGCTSSETAGQEPDLAASTAASVPMSVTATPTSVPEPLPAGYADLLEKKIASGEWTLETGLVTLLKMFVGEIPLNEAGLGPGVLVTEGTGVLQLAELYLQSGSDQATKDEITRLIDLLIPTQEALDAYSIPEDQATARGQRAPGLAAPSNQDPIECARLWERGFPNRALPSFPCFKFGEREIDGIVHRVYSPLAWRGDTSRDPYFSATLEAVEESIAVYKALGTVKRIYIVFSTLDYRGFDATTYYGWYYPREACPILIHLVATTRNDPIAFKQLIAHEIAHCFQSWNLTDQLLGPGAQSKWWSEGMAEYFSNVVYKDVNAEHQYKDEFASLSTTTPLTGMSYENFAFFQFMGNRIGPEGVIRLMRTLPTSPGVDAQLAALAAIPGIEFDLRGIRALGDRQQPRRTPTGARSSSRRNSPIRSSSPISKARSLPARPLWPPVTWWSSPARSGSTAETRSIGEGRSAWRVSEPAGDWGPFPASASGRCNELQVLMYAMTTSPGAEREETLSTTSVTADPCDECLIGRWEATNDSLVAYLQSVIAAGGAALPKVEGTTGTQFLVFQGDGTGSGGYEQFKVHETGLAGVATTEVYVTFDGFAGGPYTADGSTLIAAYEAGTAGAGVIVVTAELFANGASVGTSTIPFRPEDLPVASGIPTTYSCEGDTLTMFPPAEGAAVAPIVYVRASP